MNIRKIKTAFVSVYCKEGLAEVIGILNSLEIRIFSTGGTSTFIREQGIAAETAESLTTYPSILGGRVKTLHPSIFGGILARREKEEDIAQLALHNIPEIDLVIVDLYPFTETLAATDVESEIIEKIDIGGISLIRAGAKNYRDVLTVSSREQYQELLSLLKGNNGFTTLEERQKFAARAFAVTSAYDTAVFNYFNRGNHTNAFRISADNPVVLRYGENPHQKGLFYGNLDEILEKLSGKEISYNNILDIDAAAGLVAEFEKPAFVIIKHNNACGAAEKDNLMQAWRDALAGDPVSAFGGVLACNRVVDSETAKEIDGIFFEIIISPGYETGALDILRQKKNRIILVNRGISFPAEVFRNALNGVLWQERDNSTEGSGVMKPVTERVPDGRELNDLEFALKIVKHTKSNAMVIAKNGQLCASGAGQTSRVDALRHAVEKAGMFGFELNGAVLASDAFFPFPDSVEIAGKAGITAIVQPGGSLRDADSIKMCNNYGLAMVFTGIRHFRH